MSATTKIVYETKPWLTGEYNLTINTAPYNDCGCPAARNTPPERLDTDDDGISNYIQMGYSRSVSILFSLTTGSANAKLKTNAAAIIGWIKTADATPIYIPVPMLYLKFHSGELPGFAGSEGYNATTYLADSLIVDDDNFKPAGLGGTPTFAFNDPNAVGTDSAYDGTGASNSHSILKMENGWGLDGFTVSFHEIETSGNMTAGFLYSLA